MGVVGRFLFDCTEFVVDFEWAIDLEDVVMGEFGRVMMMRLSHFFGGDEIFLWQTL